MVSWRAARTGSSKLGLVIALAALAAAGRMAFVWLPNVAPTYAITFLAGVAFGIGVGFWTGFLSMAVTNLLLSGFHPILLANGPAMGLLGLAGGLMGRFINFGQKGDEPPFYAAGLAMLMGVLATLAFSLLADAFSFVLFYQQAAGGAAFQAFVALVVAGLAFNALPSLANGVIFALGSYPVLRALRKANLLPSARPPAAPTVQPPS